jgi:regulator of nucleoside diphosphate kinase
VISAADLASLEGLVDSPAVHPSVRAALREKLDAAVVVPEEELPPNVVTLRSRVTYRIDDGPPECRTLIAADEAYQPGHSLPVATPAGVCLIGLAEGEAAPLPSARGRLRMLKVEDLVWQPARAHRTFFVAAPYEGSKGFRGMRRPIARRAGPTGAGQSWRMPPSGDDPGPRAA